MALEATRAHILRRVEAYSGPRPVEELALELAARLGQIAPQQSGVLAEVITEIGGPKREPEGWRIGVGNAERSGSPEAKPPARTIGDFLDEFPEYRSRNVSGGPGWDKRLAWWFLPAEGKKALAQARIGGEFGGPSYFTGAPARYYYVQSADFPQWQDSAYEAGLEGGPNIGFTSRALAEWRDVIGNVIRRVLSAAR